MPSLGVRSPWVRGIVNTIKPFLRIIIMYTRIVQLTSIRRGKKLYGVACVTSTCVTVQEFPG